jgi:hypothetical protein
MSNTSLKADLGGFSLSPKTDMLYISACLQVSLACQGSELIAFNGTSQHVQWTTAFPFWSGATLAINLSTNTIYAIGGENYNTTLIAVDGSTGNLLYSDNIGSSCMDVGFEVFDPATDDIYASVGSGGPSFLLVIDSGDGQIKGMLSLPQYTFFNSFVFDPIGLNPTNGEVYVPMGNSLAVLTSRAIGNVSYVDAKLLPQGECLP